MQDVNEREILMIGHVVERMTELDITKCRNSNPVLRPIVIVLEQIEIVDFEMFGVSGRVLGRIDTQRSIFVLATQR